MKINLKTEPAVSKVNYGTQPATRRKPVGHNLPLGGNLPDTTSRFEETCRTQPSTGRKPAGHNQPPEENLPDTTSRWEENCRTQTATGRKPAGHKQPNTPVSAPSVATWSQSHLFRGTAWTGDRKSTELQHPHTVNEMATRLPKVNSGTVSHDWQVSIFDIYLQKLCLL